MLKRLSENKTFLFVIGGFLIGVIAAAYAMLADQATPAEAGGLFIGWLSQGVFTGCVFTLLDTRKLSIYEGLLLIVALIGICFAYLLVGM